MCIVILEFFPNTESVLGSGGCLKLAELTSIDGGYN